MTHPIGPFDAVIFDMDGVLLDTERLYREASFAACEALGFAMTDAVHMATVGVPADAADRIIIEAMGEAFPFEDFNRTWRGRMREKLDAHVPVKAGVPELLGWLAAADVPAAVATSTGHAAAHEHLHRAGLKPFFRTIVTRDDVDRGKPHPEPYLTAAARLDVDPVRCLAIEDSHNGVRAAHAAGMATVMVPDLLEPTEEIAALCIAVHDSLVHLHDALAAGRRPVERV